MKAAGYDAQQIGDVYASHGGTLRQICQNLRCIGYSDAFAATCNLYPENPSQVMDFVGSNEAGQLIGHARGRRTRAAPHSTR